MVVHYLAFHMHHPHMEDVLYSSALPEPDIEDLPFAPAPPGDLLKSLASIPVLSIHLALLDRSLLSPKSCHLGATCSGGCKSAAYYK